MNDPDRKAARILRSVHAHLSMAATAPQPKPECESEQQPQWNASGKLLPHVTDQYHRDGFVILRRVIGSDELADLRKEVTRILARAPAKKGDERDRDGNPCLGNSSWYQFAPSLRSTMDRRAEVELRRSALLAVVLNAPGECPLSCYCSALLTAFHFTFLRPCSQPADPTIVEWPVKISNWLTFSTPGIRLYGHPKLLAVAAVGSDWIARTLQRLIR